MTVTSSLLACSARATRRVRLARCVAAFSENGAVAFARALTSASEGEDEWVYDVYEMMDEDARDSDDDDFDDGYAPVIRVRDFHDVADDEDAESDYGDSDSNAAGYFDDYPDTESDSSEYSDRFEDDDDDEDDDWS